MTVSTRTVDQPLSAVGDTTGAALQLQSVRKVYGDHVVARDISLDIAPGEFVTLLGASGSGKTTLLRMIAGFLEPTSGGIRLDGRDITALPVHRRRIGMVFQNYALFPHMNVLKNVMFPLEMHKVPKADRKTFAREALAAVRLEGFEERMPSQLSGGQQQRVALARAIVMKPRLLLMDEPLGALDRRLREAMQIEILKLSRELGLTVINVTHDQEEAFTMSDRIALLADGNLVQYAAPEELYSAPASEVAAEFLGESNLFAGPLERSADGWVVRAADATVSVTDAAAAGWAEGDQVVAVVRPWSIEPVPEPSATTAPAAAGAAGGACISGTVAAVIYAGESQKILVDAEGGRELVVRRTLDDAEELETGAPIGLRWRAEHVVITSPKAR
jgi:putative spermidine/putrescine transport system ATP-binding protein